MTQRVTVRQMVEFEIDVDDREGWEFELEDFNQKVAEGRIDVLDVEGEIKVLATEIVSRKHVVNYVFDVNEESERFILLADGESVFEHRNHDEVVLEWGRRTGNPVTFSDTPREARGSENGLWWSYGDPDEAWATIKSSRG